MFKISGAALAGTAANNIDPKVNSLKYCSFLLVNCQFCYAISIEQVFVMCFLIVQLTMLIAREVAMACRSGVEVMISLLSFASFCAQHCFLLYILYGELGGNCCWRSQFLLRKYMGE